MRQLTCGVHLAAYPPPLLLLVRSAARPAPRSPSWRKKKDTSRCRAALSASRRCATGSRSTARAKALHAGPLLLQPARPSAVVQASARRTTAMAGVWSSPYAAMVEGGARPAPPWPGAEARPAVRRASLLLLSSVAAHRHFTPWLMPGHGSPAHLALLLFCGRGSLATCAWPAVEGDAHSMWVEPRPLFRCRGNPYLERICSPGLDPTP